MSMPQATTSVFTDDGKSTMFYIRSGNIITSLVSTSLPEVPDDNSASKRYNQVDILLNGKSVVTNSFDLAALRYDPNHVRLYFIDGNSVLQELCNDGTLDKDGKPVWTQGSLGDATRTTSPYIFKAEKGSPVTCHVGGTGANQQLKVYFYKAGNTAAPAIAYTTLGSDTWTLKTTV